MFRVRVLLLFIPLLLVTTAFATEVKLLAIRATGSQEFSEAEIARASGLKVNQTIGPAEFKNAADRLASTGAFAQVGYKYGPLGSGMFVEFELEDAPNFLPVRFENYVWSSEQDLNAKLAERVPLFHGRLPEGGQLVEDVTSAITALLTEAGIPGHAAMRLHSAGLGKPVDGISFTVEGVPLKITSIELKGTAQVSKADIEAQLKPVLGTAYERDVVEESVQYHLLPLYQRQGLLKVEFGTPEVTVAGTKEAPEIAISIPVREGLQYRFGAFHFGTSPVFTAEELSKKISLKTGDTANLPALLSRVRAAIDDFGNKGYMEAKFDVTPEYHDESKTVDYEITPREGRLFRMGVFEVKGLDSGTAAKAKKSWKLATDAPFNGKYEDEYVKANPGFMRGHPVRITRQVTEDAHVNVTIEF